MAGGMDTATPSDRPPAGSADSPPAGPLGERWVTLRELADAREISQHSAARLVRRHRWRRQTDNQGHVRALVPTEALDRTADRPGAMPPASPVDGPGAGPARLSELAAAIDSMVSLLRGQLGRAESRADAAEAARADAQARADRSLAQLADAAARSDAEITTLRDAIDGMRATLARTEDRAAGAEERAVRAEGRVAGLEAAATAQGERAELAEAQIAKLELDLQAKDSTWPSSAS